ncbi:MAG: two-component system, response regulator, stage 0 sporulation protein [Tepidanaerobacteraceae bacterium]|nr:two-component system, response regulator, stage 0 sporulation protein [Tepidanaerobacteraceae bacterium]
MERCKVMVVDDQLWVRTMLLEALSSSGYLTFGAADGREALHMMHEEKPDIALIDMTIPGIDGFTLLAHLKDEKPEVATILMSGNSDINYINRARKEGACGYLVKPFDMEELKSLLARISTTLDTAARGEGIWATEYWEGQMIS